MRRILVALIAVVLIAAAAILILRLLYPLPDISARAHSSAMQADSTSRLGQYMAEASSAHPGKSGVVPLQRGHDALASRLALVEAAEQSVDVQYYIWHDDTSGILLLEALLNAAQRGVRVRMLLDDNGVPGLDAFMAALNAEDNLEIRLFNPSTVRSPKMMGYLFDFPRMNRRMHNKSLIVDGAAAIIGGRNIGDEYFQVGDDVFYIDMDVLATGAVVAETAQVFDAYWNSRSVHAVETIIDGEGDIDAFRVRAGTVKTSEAAAAFKLAMDTSAKQFADGRAPLEWTDVQLVADDPVKGEGTAEPQQLMIFRLEEILGGVKGSLTLVSAYFVPGEQGTDHFASLARNGVEVGILTNAMNTTDVLMVHAGYAKYRKALLQSGVNLYELKLRGGMADESGRQLNPLGLSGASLHAKTFAVDDERVFIGSFNFDPRSAILNCEMGYLIKSPSMARQVNAVFQSRLEALTYRPELDADGEIVWRDTTSDGRHVTFKEEPGSTWLNRAALTLIGLLPVEWLL